MICVLGIELNRRIRVDWPSIAAQNKGLFVVEKDYQFPGGYYVRHKSTPYYLPAGRHDIKLMIENALAALGKNYGPIILAKEDDADKIMASTKQIMELLHTELSGNKESESYLKFLWGILNGVTVHSRALPLWPKIALK